MVRTEEQQVWIDAVHGWGQRMQEWVHRMQRPLLRKESKQLRGDLDQASQALLQVAEALETEWPVNENSSTDSSWLILSRPCADNWPVTQPYGYDPSYPANNGWHYGKDYGTPVGTECWCREAGTVTLADPDQPVDYLGVKDGAWGNYVEIVSDRDVSVSWGLAHLSEIRCSVGQHVEAAEVIGRTGGRPGDPGAGTSTGPHLHEQKLVNDVRIDPDG